MKNSVFISLLFCFYLSAQSVVNPLLTTDQQKQTQWVDSLYHQLSLDEKIGQLFMVMAFSEKGEEHYAQIEEQVENSHLGGIIFSLGGPVQQAIWTNKLQKKAKVPLLIGMDAEWGIAMRLDSVRPFPWNMTLGAIQDNNLITAIGQRIGEQAARLGVHINFAPDVDINTNPLNPIIGNRSFGEDKLNVSSKAKAFIKGMHSAGVLSSAKHFPGHGDTAKDSHHDLPVIHFTKDRLRNTELFPFQESIEVGVSSVMIGHLNVPAFDPGVPASLSPKIIQEELIDRYSYKGLVITDALNMGAATELKNIQSVSLAAFLAGNDILLIPNDLEKEIRKIKKAYKRGIITEERLEKSVKKILQAKYKVGLHTPQSIKIKDLHRDLNTPLDDFLIKKSMEEAVTLIKTDTQPFLPKDETIGFVSLGDASGEVFKQQLQRSTTLQIVDFKGNIEQTLKNLDGAKTVVVGFHRSNATPWKASDFSKNERMLIQALSKHFRVVLASFVKPYALRKIEALDQLDVLVQGYQNNPEAQRAVANLLLGKGVAKGKLPVSIQPYFKVGTGIETEPIDVLRTGTHFEAGIDEQKLAKLDHLAQTVLDSMMAPGFQILAARYGQIFYHKAFGHQTYKKEKPVDLTDVYDVASLTKILSTLPLAMQAVDQGVFSLDNTLGELSEQFQNTNKDTLILREVLSHQAGIVPWVPFYQTTLKRKNKKRNRKYYRPKQYKRYSVPVAQSIFGHNDLPALQFKALLDTDLLEKGLHYSDLPFIFLQKILEEKFDEKLNTLADKVFFSSLGLEATTYLPLEKLEYSQVVPSENDQYFRHQELVGYVHDMTTALQGGISGHAGLFSNAKEVAVIMQLYLQGGTYNGKTYFSKDTFDLFNTCNYCPKGNRKGVGLDKPKESGGGMTFQGISLDSFGHAGFTGTYAWADPDTGIVFVFLSNRTYPTMENRLLIDHSIRPRMLKLVHDAIIY